MENRELITTRCWLRLCDFCRSLLKPHEELSISNRRSSLLLFHTKVVMIIFSKKKKKNRILTLTIESPMQMVIDFDARHRFCHMHMNHYSPIEQPLIAWHAAFEHSSLQSLSPHIFVPRLQVPFEPSSLNHNLAI